MCLYPKYILNPKYKPTKKNGGNVPPVKDNRTLYVPIGCQTCIECRKRKSREWQVRLLEDIKTNTNGKFITLTFSDEQYAALAEETEATGYNLDNQIATTAVRRFLERWRKVYGKSLRHWLVTELGHNGTKNIHLHGIIWTDTPLDNVEKIWQYGWVWKGKTLEQRYGSTIKRTTINYVNDKTISYITKYVTKVDQEHQYYKPIILTSNGIGSNYFTTGDYKRNHFNGTQTRETYKTRSGHSIAMPIYWRNKLYTDEQKEELWLNTLDKQKRYVLKQPIDISKGLNEYFRAVIYARTTNTVLGYGTPKIDEERLQYERQQRELMQYTRINKAKAKAPSAGSLAKGLGLNIGPYTTDNTFRSKGRGLQDALERQRRNVDNLIWITYNTELNSSSQKQKT